MKKIILSLVLYLSIFGVVSAGISTSDLNNNGVEDSTESEVVLDHDATLPAGEYNFKNLIITNSSKLTLERDENLADPFKGVKINAVNLTVLSDSSISADGINMYGTNYGPGVSPDEFYYIGASYGGLAYNSKVNNTYGSATKPIDLGSDGYFKGGGAIRLSVSGTLLNEGVISAIGGSSASGGSIYITTTNLSGSGSFSANGGTLFGGGYFKSPGGGGRIAIYYETNSFTGTAEAKGGCGSYSWPIVSCGENGTVGFFDVINNDLTIDSFWRFQINDSPFNFNNIYIKNNGGVKGEEGVSINTKELSLDQNSSITFSKNQILNISKITVDNNSSLTFSGLETLNSSLLSVNNSSTVTVLPENKLHLKISSITISPGSSISVEGKGYGANTGPGATTADMYRVGASYGGVGYLNTLESVYGSELEPVDLGSGGSGYNPRGGGAIRIESDDLINDGLISANGLNTSSGGSVYVTTKKLSGRGLFSANGGSSYCPNICMGPGGGGRIAIYYEKNTFSGVATASGWSGYGGSSGAGTVVMKELENGASNVLFIPGLEASRLYMDEGGSENQLWEPNRNLDVEKLYLNSDGTSINDVYTRDIIKETNIPMPLGFAGQNIYKTFSNTMNDLVSQGKINRWESYAYDWRQDINDILENGTPYFDGSLSLVAMLQTLVETSKNKKVTIIAHSNGGLLAKALINKLQEENNPLLKNIDVLILVASPQIGTPSAVSAILHGYDQKILAGEIMTEWRARELGRNMLGAYGLLPSQEYFNKVSTSPVFFKDNQIPSGVTTNFVNNYGASVDSYLEYKNFLFGNEGRENPEITNVIQPIRISSAMFSRSENLHGSIDNWIPPQSLRVIEVAGWGLDTVAGFNYYPKYSCLIPDSGMGKCGYVLDEKPVFTVDGDKTVVVPSAHYTDGVEKYWVDINEHNKQLFLSARRNRQHKDILEIDSLNNLVVSVLQKNSIVFDKVLKNTEPTYSGNKLRLSVHSPVTIGAYDSYGNFTGKVCPENSDFCYVKEEILNSTYMEFGEGKYLNLDEGDVQKVVLKGNDFGTFTFESEKVLPDGSSSVLSFKDIPVNPKTVGEITLNTSSGQSELKLDEDGDGINDFTIASNDSFDPIQFLRILRKNIQLFNINKGQKQKLYSRIDDIIKNIEKNKIDKASKKVEQFIKILENNFKHNDRDEDNDHIKESEDGEIKKLSPENIKMLVISLNKLLINLK